MGAKLNLEGQRFGRLTVVSLNEGRKWLCLCDCGNKRIVCTKSLRSGNTQSCGCKRTDTIRRVCTTHGMAHSKLYHVWATIVQRCCNANNIDYPNYGGRGITLFKEWRDSYQAFYDYVSKLPHFGDSGYSLDRIDNDRNYEPNNVRWASPKDQANNRRKRR